MAVGGLGETLTGPAATGGFAAAGAILLALAVIASEEIAVLPFLHGSYAAKLLEAQTPADAGAVDPNAPFNSLARAAIGAAHQGVFDLDFRAGLLTLSPEAAQMVGLSAHETTLSHGDWVALVHPDDRDVYTQALEEYREPPGPGLPAGIPRPGTERAVSLAGAARHHRHRTGCAVRLPGTDLRHHPAQGSRIRGDRGGGAAQARSQPAARCPDGAGQPRGADGGAGCAGRRASTRRCWRCWIWTASRPSMPAWAMAAPMPSSRWWPTGWRAWASRRRSSGSAATVSPFCSPARARAGQPIGNALVEVCARPYRLDGREVFAPCSIGLADAARRARTRWR